MNQHLPGHLCPLYTRPQICRFDGSGVGLPVTDLARHLQEVDHDTSLRRADSASELQLTPAGVAVRDGYTFTRAAFSQAASLLGAGLAQFMPNLAGMTGHGSQEGVRLVDAQFAIRFWNELIDLRFPVFARYRVIRNARLRTIEGFVGRDHQYLENSRFYQLAVATLQGYDPHVSVYAASLGNRRLSLWLRRSTASFSVRVDGRDWPFYTGYYLTNGEAAKAAVRGTVAVFTPSGVCLAPYGKFGRRVMHTGKRFQTRLATMLEAVGRSSVPQDQLELGAKLLLTKSLGFPTGMSATARKERMKKIRHALGLLGVQRNLANEVIDLALSDGRHYGKDAVEWSQVQQLYAGRNVLDLFVPLLGLARRLDASRRERMEQAAFDILMGRLLL